MIQLDLFGTPQSPCSIAQALSALVKMVRVRRYEDALYWYVHVNALFSGDRFRLNRRVLVMSCEDCIVPSVIEKAGEWWRKSLSKKNQDEVMYGAAALLYLVCHTKNWWEVPLGQKYIERWRLVDKECRDRTSFTFDEMKNAFQAWKDAKLGEKAVLEAHTLHRKSESFNAVEYAGWLYSEVTNQYAERIAKIPAQAGKLLSFDDNFTGMALYTELFGAISSEEMPTIPNDYIGEVMERVMKEVFSNPRKPPAWTQDGIHCSGTDRRFAGMLAQMLSCCRAFNHYGRLDPNDEWLEEFYANPVFE